MDRIALNQWARDAVALTLYECLLSAARQLDNGAELMRGEACWRAPSEDEWLRWQAARKIRDDLTRPPE
jgi:hypothetical protein